MTKPQNLLLKAMLVCSALAFTLAAAGSARAETITFDDVPVLGSGSSAVAIAGDRYQSQGILISAYVFGPYVGANTAGTNTPPNYLFASQTINGSANGAIFIDFVLPGTLTPGATDSVSFFVVGSDSEVPRWTAAIYDRNLMLLEVITGNTNSFVSFSRADGNIGRVAFFPSVFREGIDTLTFSTVTPYVAPEPATMTLLATGLAGVGAAVRRRRKAGKG